LIWPSTRFVQHRRAHAGPVDTADAGHTSSAASTIIVGATSSTSVIAVITTLAVWYDSHVNGVNTIAKAADR
jgi:hypothetical protein